MKRKQIALYSNGNYMVRLYDDGTKIKETMDDKFIALFPDSIDLKITNYCDRNCPMCHEKSSTSGNHASLDAEFLKTLKRGTELAIGGGNPLSHPNLMSFLEQMKEQGVICNITVNEKHLEQMKEQIEYLIESKLIYGLGVSIQEYNQTVVDFAKEHPNTVLHLINGIFKDFDKIAHKGLKILILGYKKFGRGLSYFNAEIEKQMNQTRENIADLISKFKLVSFDNLALEQLNISSVISQKSYDQMYMGDDGEGSMYIDLCERKFAKSSTSTARYELENDIKLMFAKIQRERV